MKQPKNTFPVHNHMRLVSADADRCRYVFVDSAEHHADRILMGALIPVKFEPPVPQHGRSDASDSGSLGCELRVCSFQTRYESWFLCCMSDLEWVLQAECDYIQACEELLGPSVVIQGAMDELEKQKEAPRPFVPKAGLGRLGLKPAEAAGV